MQQPQLPLIRLICKNAQQLQKQFFLLLLAKVMHAKTQIVLANAKIQTPQVPSIFHNIYAYLYGTTQLPTVRSKYQPTHICV